MTPAQNSHSIESTLLSVRLKERIVRGGPMSVECYMDACLSDATAGYYPSKQPIGAGGDFITAPEVSQVFGELLGLWSYAVWQSMGSPDPVIFAELGPGRGTLMADALRALHRLPGFVECADVVLVETSPLLRGVQQETLAGCGTRLSWRERIEALPPGPLIVIANEFIDALPIRQIVWRGGQWRERCVQIGAKGGFEFCDGPAVASDGLRRDAQLQQLPEGSILEIRPAANATVAALAGRASQAPLAALIIDYGHEATECGDTLQAVSRHKFADPLRDPGAVDLTAHVDFGALKDAAEAKGLRVYGPKPQGALLLELGLEARLEKLCEDATDDQRDALVSGTTRLVDPEAMGLLFKAMAIASPDLPLPPPSDKVPNDASAMPMTTDDKLRIHAPNLAAIDGIGHGFFTRLGGSSEGLYESLNCGVGSRDAPEAVAENRTRVTKLLGAAPGNLATVYQKHSNVAVVADGSWTAETRPEADAVVTATPGVVAAIVTADCAPVLLCDPEARVVGAAHAGWRGAFTGIVEATVEAMKSLGAEPRRIVAAIGPAISQGAYEVGEDYKAQFLETEPDSGIFFANDEGSGEPHFDLPAYVAGRLARAGAGNIYDLGLCTYFDEWRFYSYRRSQHHGEPDYGRQISAIVLT